RCELLDDCFEEGWRNRQIVRGVLCCAELLADRLKGRCVAVVATDIAQQTGELRERRRVEAAVLLDTVLGSRPQLLDAPARLGHANNRYVEVPTLDHRLQRGKDLLVREIAGCAEEYQCIGTGFAHRASLRWMIICRQLSQHARRIHIASRRESDWRSRLRRVN